MKKTHLIIISFLAVLMFFQAAVKPYLNRQEALNVVKTVLEQWQNRDLTRAMDQWEDPKTYPIVYSVDTFKIKRTKFFKNRGQRLVHIEVFIEFEAGNKVLPSQKDWLFELRNTALGWKIVDFALMDTKEFGEASL